MPQAGGAEEFSSTLHQKPVKLNDRKLSPTIKPLWGMSIIKLSNFCTSILLMHLNCIQPMSVCQFTEGNCLVKPLQINNHSLNTGSTGLYCNTKGLELVDICQSCRTRKWIISLEDSRKVSFESSLIFSHRLGKKSCFSLQKNYFPHWRKNCNMWKTASEMAAFKRELTQTMHRGEGNAIVIYISALSSVNSSNPAVLGLRHTERYLSSWHLLQGGWLTWEHSKKIH